MQLLPRQGGERVRESHLLFQIKVREETQLFLFCILFSLFFLAFFIACARVAADLPANKLRKP